ncbi:bifunctional UDP-sugar hydrolase/5'-nucleotidase [Serratia sp. DD3]|uniref:bifunctional metallophosphatase/5'-nucleotidase n=1 Tax=Serratia sp. DD3 TaxID=1410619 RepID=UPI0003C4FA3C|nr:5'-nucleotidase C-terminal domain-containing protein [Serratia sp. DD3]KEY57782.1 NAD 5'-nucleotidase [Serratia sp. DD3]
MKKKILPLTLSLALAISLVSGCGDSDNSVANSTPDTPQPQPISIQLLHTNDHHSHLEGQPYTLMLDYDPNQQGNEPVQVDLGGFARIANAISTYRNNNTLVVNNGELNGTLYFSLFKGEADFMVFNTLGLDAYQLGNHEFDEGDARLAELIAMADFPILSANIHPQPASPLYGSDIKPYIIKEIDGEKVAIIGVIKVEKTKESSMVSDDVDFSEEFSSTEKYVKEVEALGINKILVISHLGYDFDKKLAASIDGIDLIISGDTHELLDSTGEIEALGITAQGPYPTIVNNTKGEPVYIVEAWEYAKALGVLNIDFDASGKVLKAAGNPELLVGGPYKVKDSSNNWVLATAAEETAISTAISQLKVVKEMEPSAEIMAVIQPYKTQIESFVTQKIGSVTTPLGFERIPTPFASGSEPNGSFAAQVVADAFLQYIPNADFAIQNAGGVRAPFNQGEFTVADAYTVLPFSNKITTIKIKGKDVVQVLEEALNYSQGLSGSTGAFPYASNLRYDVVLGRPAGEGIRNVEVRDRKTGAWAPIDLEKTYVVVTNSFTALGKDGYVTFGRLRGENPANFSDSDASYSIPLIEYFLKVLPDSTLSPPESDNFSLKSVSH